MKEGKKESSMYQSYERRTNKRMKKKYQTNEKGNIKRIKEKSTKQIKK